jgi:hypothetical protein
MSAATVKVIGADRVAATMHDFADDLRDLSDAHDRAGALLVRAAQAGVRRRSGALGASIVATVTATGPTVTAGNSGVRYAGPIEGGWRAHGIEPQKYMSGALKSQHDGVIETYIDAVDKAAQQIKGA